MSENETSTVIQQYLDAFLQHDPMLLSALIAEDCVIEDLQPAPDGARIVGRADCLAAWQSLAANPATHVEIEEVLITGERAIILMRLTWGEGELDTLRGVNIMRVRDGLIVEGLGYSKK
jgi:hypothetical protein